jgi:hypothetical protein
MLWLILNAMWPNGLVNLALPRANPADFTPTVTRRQQFPGAQLVK